MILLEQAARAQTTAEFLDPIIQVDGGTCSRGRHVRGAGFERDAEKRNEAVLAGWRGLHFTLRHIKSGIAVRTIEALLKKRA